MVRFQKESNNGAAAVSLAYMRGEKVIKRVSMSDLTNAEERQVREEARATGETFQSVAYRILKKQRKINDY